MRAAILLVAVIALGACSATAAASVQPTVATPFPIPVKGAAVVVQQAELRLDVVELTCHSCAGQVAEGTARIPGVLRVSAEILDHMLVVRYDPSRLSEASLIAAIDRVVDSVAQ